MGCCTSHFVISQALESAHMVLSQNQTLSLHPEEQLRFYQLLENPPAVNAKLSKAIERYKRVINDDSEV